MIYRTLTIACACALLMACGQQEQTSKTNADSTAIQVNAPGDLTVYALACDGCTDTLLVYLPYIGSDPDTLNILEASRQHRVLGRPNIGDQLAIVVNAEDSTVADLVVNMEELKGEWCYLVTPKLRERAGVTLKSQQQMMKALPDSLQALLMQPREYGFQLKDEYAARPIGSTTTNADNDDSPVVYPPLKRYREWALFNGRLILKETALDTLGNVTIASSDTAELKLLRPDTLVLRFSDGERGYYKRKAEPAE